MIAGFASDSSFWGCFYAGRPLEVFADGQKNALSMIASAAGVSGSAITSTWSTILLRVAERGDENYQGSS